MLRKIITLGVAVAIIAAIIATSLLTPPARGQEGISITGAAVTPRFPLEITYQVSAASASPIVDIRLHYSIEQIGFAEVTAEAIPQFNPGTSVSAVWKWDMRRSGGLPPGALIDYWWTVRNAAGQSVSTARAQLKFDDTRFRWRSVSSGRITLLWYEGTETFARDLLETSLQAADRLAQDTGAVLTRDVRLYIYANSNDLRGSMIFPQEWTGGVAFTNFGVIAIGISSFNLTWGKRAISHELTHLITHQMVRNPYNGIPVWLEEGLAMYNEGPMESQFSNALQRAIDANRLFTVQTLSSPFSADTEKSFLAYAQSASVVDYLIRTYGKDKMFQLLDTFRQGSRYDDALRKVYGLDTKSLNAEWKNTVLGRKVNGRQPALAHVLLGAGSLLWTWVD